MNVAALGLEARRGRILVLWLLVVTMAYAGFISLFYANVAANAAEFKKLIEIYPKEILLAFGIEGDFADPAVFLTGYVYNFLWPLIAAIAGIVLGTRVAADADRGFLDLALSTPLTRTTHLGASIVAQVVGLALISVSLVAAILGADLFIEPDFPADRVALTAAPALVFGVAIAGPATLLAVILLDRGRAAAIVAGVLVVMYLLDVVAALAPEWDAVATVSAFRYFDLKGLLQTGAYPVADTLLLGGIGVAAWLAALLVFRRRDLAA
jgi:ABC-2 type transport system permease protein